MRLIFEMETSDPDDFLTLLWLADHPDIELLGVAVTPGSKDQCRLARWALDRCGREDLPLGSFHGPSWWDGEDGKKERVSDFHYRVYGEEIRAHRTGDVEIGPALIQRLLSSGGDTTILVGCAPKSIGAWRRTHPAIEEANLSWVQQGGFAGDNLVVPEHRLEKFAGRLTCPSFNPGGAWKQTLELLADDRFVRRTFVSKNVCHGVVWNETMQAQLSTVATNLRPGLRWMIHGLDRYLRDKGIGKAMHDLVAAAVAVDPSVCAFKEVEIYREKGEWGAREKAGTGTCISVAYDPARFLEVLAR